MVNKIENYIKGAFVGFAIGDAMGATTEFMNKKSIKVKYGEVTDIIGGGWLNLIAGEVTDDTQMMICVADALIKSKGDFNIFIKNCCDNFVNWYNSAPIDIGNQCLQVISKFSNKNHYSVLRWYDEAKDDKALGNGALMRVLPTVFFDEKFAKRQGALTHNNGTCECYSVLYRNVIRALISDEFTKENTKRILSEAVQLMSPTGHVKNTFHNAVYWFVKTDSFYECIVGCVNDGGDADTIAAISGSMAGAYYGFDNIPDAWKDKIDSDVYSKILDISESITKMYLEEVK